MNATESFVAYFSAFTMPAKHCLILAAGFGTRMGAIGTQLPKVLWPVFGQSLLELQLRFARHLGYDSIWINLFHQADIILERTRSNPIFQDVHWLRETPEILDIGGGIHNLAAQPEVQYQGELLVLNADQFLWFTASELQAWKKNSAGSDVLLLNWMVNSSQGYNQVESNTNRVFQRVVKNAELPRDIRIETYSGNSIIRLDSLRPSVGPSNFFASVCNPSHQLCKTALLQDGKYWDFGTAARYWDSMKGVLLSKAKGDEDAFTRFIEETGAFDRSRFHAAGPSYGCHQANVIHLGTGNVPGARGAGVILEGNAGYAGVDAMLEFNGVTQTL